MSPETKSSLVLGAVVRYRYGVQRTTLVILFMSLAATACVTKKKYTALERQLHDSQAALDGTLAQKTGLEAERARLEAELARMVADRDAISSERQALQAGLDAVKRELAGRSGELAQKTKELADVLSDRKALKDSAERMKIALQEAADRQRAAEARIAEFKHLVSKFQALIDAGKLRVRMIDGRMVLQLPTDILFDSGQAKLSSVGAEAIHEIGRVLAAMPDRRFQVEGHTDNIPIKTSRFPSNWELASARALGVVKELTVAGMVQGQLSAASYGEARPTTTNDTEEGRRQNRRIEISVVPDLSTLPGYGELKSLGS